MKKFTDYLNEKLEETKVEDIKEIDIKELIGEAAPPSKDAKLWMIDNKEEYKKKHGDKWEGVLYAKAWDKFNDGDFGDPDNIEDKGEDIDDDELNLDFEESMNDNEMEELDEKSPPSKEAEKWIEDNKEKFKKKYGDEWKKVIYSTAWKMHNKGSFDESTAPTTTTAGVAIAPQPIFKKEKNLGYNSIVVDEDSYNNLIYKEKNKHWKRYMQDPKSEFGNAVKKEYLKSNKLILKNSKTGEMVFIK